MKILERLKMEIQGIDYTDAQLDIYLQENMLLGTDEYNPKSSTAKKNILKTALNILESVANNVDLMRDFKLEEMTVTQFSENLQRRIDALDRKIRMIKEDDNTYADGASFTYMFTE